MKKPDQKYYIAIDLKSFYASVECVERGLDPLDTNLVVADSSRTDKTICLAVEGAWHQRSSEAFRGDAAGASDQPRARQQRKFCFRELSEKRSVDGR